MRQLAVEKSEREIKMNAKEILNKQFEKAKIGGYKLEEVDDFLKEVSDEFAQLQKNNSELEEKLKVLADKIREYREDEEALKDALLIAQKQGNAIVADSKASAEKLTQETKDKVEKLLTESKAKSEKMINDANDYSTKTRADADATAEKTIGDANNKAAEIKAAMDKQQMIQEEIIRRTRKEATEFMEKVRTACEAQIELVNKMPSEVENDFIKRTAEEAERREEERRKAEEQRIAKAKAEAAKNAAAQQKLKEAAAKAKAEAAKAEAAKPETAPEEKAEQPAKPSKGGKPGAQKSVKAADVLGGVSDKTAENNLPFFNSDSQSITRHENLKFGKNNGGKN